MRISLLDPKWKEQKSLEEERRKDTNVAGDEDINRALKQFAERRTDIFGDKEVAIGETVGKSAAEESAELASKVHPPALATAPRCPPPPLSMPPLTSPIDLPH